MSTKKLDEASVATMINGFLAGKKKKVNEARKNATSRKNNAFWKSIVESVMLEVGREDPDDWKQQLDFSQGGGIRGLDTGGFSVDDSETSKVGTPVHAQDEQGSEPKADQKHGKRAVTGEYIQKVIKARLKQIKEREPQLWAQFNGMGDEEKRSFKRKLWDQHKEKENLRKASGAQSGGGRTNQQKRVEIVGNLVGKVLQKMVDLTREGQPIPSNLASLSTNFLGFKPTNNVGKPILAKLAQMEGPLSPEVVNQFVTKALENKKEGNVIDFANTRFDMYPGDWQDGVEDTANKQNIPGSRDKERGIGTGVKTVYTEPRQGFKMPNSDKAVSDADEEVKKSVVGRKGTGNTPVYRMFKDFGVDDILKYFDYYQQNPKEIQRARKERVGTPPESLQDLVGSVNPASKEAEIGSRHSDSILNKKEKEAAKAAWEKKGERGDVDFEPSLNLDPKDVLNRVSDFGSDEDPEYPSDSSLQGRMASGLANVFSAKGDRAKTAKAEYHRIAELLRPLLAKGENISPEEEAKISQLTKQLKLKRQEMEQVKQRPRVTPDTVADIMAKMSVRDAKGKLVKLQEPDKVEWDSEEEEEMGRRLYNRFSPKRLNVKDGDKDSESQFTLKDFIPGFAAAEEEKVAANIPAAKGAKGFERRVDNQDRDARQKKARDEMKAGKSARLSLGGADKINADEREKREKLKAATLARRGELDKEREDNDRQIGDIAGDRLDYEDVNSDMKDMLQGYGPDNQMGHDTNTISVQGKDGVEDVTPLQTFKQMQDRWEDMMKLRNPSSVDASIRGKKQGLKTSKTPDAVQADIEKLQQIRPHAVRRSELSNLPSPQQMHMGPRPPVSTPSQGFDREAVNKAEADKLKNVNRGMVEKLVKDAGKKLAVTGDEVTPERIMQHIKTNFTRGPGGTSAYPKEFAAVRDFFMNQGSSLKFESKQHSILELLVDIGDTESKHVKAKEQKQGWDKAQPEKKLNMVPKWKKSKLTLKELFKGEDHE